MAVIPYGVDNPMRRLPLVNWALIAANVAIYAHFGGFSPRTLDLFLRYGLVPAHLHWYQFLTWMFLHTSIIHLAGNMLFLWAFGNNVNDRLGHVRYLVTYVAFGALAGVGHVLATAEPRVPCVGSSGAIFGVMGMYLTFFPLNDVKMVFWFILPLKFFSCSTYWPVGFWIAFNIYQALTGRGGHVAVAAHVAGFTAGFATGLFLLAKGYVERDDYDFLSWVSRRRERKLVEQFRRGGRARIAEFGPLPSPPALAMDQGEAPRQAPSARELQKALLASLAAGDVRDAAETYQRFIALYPRLAPGETEQIEIANLLLRAGQHALAAEAYERFARFYPRHPQAAHALYSAGILLAEKDDQPAKGRQFLAEALPFLTDPAKAERARQTIDAIDRAAKADRVPLAGGEGDSPASYE